MAYERIPYTTPQYDEERAFYLGGAAFGRMHPEWGDHLRSNDRLRLCFWQWLGASAGGKPGGWQAGRVEAGEDAGMRSEGAAVGMTIPLPALLAFIFGGAAIGFGLGFLVSECLWRHERRELRGALQEMDRILDPRGDRAE